jgi:S-DNA-T family DNA segregation ATPase FtsK/SpoIIIE
MAKKAQDKSKAEVHSKPAPPRGSVRFLRYCFVLLLAGGVLLAWLSLLSFSPTDPPSTAMHPPKHPVDNRAGLVGAHLAYHLRYWLGVGVYMGLAFATAAALIMMLGGRITDWPWRVIGVALMITATSAAAYVLNPPAPGDELNGPAGVIGTGAGHFVFQKFGLAGRWVFLCVTFCIGVMLTADKLVLQIPRLGRKVWDRRGELPSMIDALRSRLPAPAAADRNSVGVTSSPRAIAAAPPTTGRLATVRPPARPNAPGVQPSQRVQLQPAKRLPASSAGPSAPASRPGPSAPGSPPKSSAPAGTAVAQKAPPKPDKAQPKQADKSPPVSAKQAGDPQARKFQLPSADLLADPSGGYEEQQEQAAEQKRAILQQTLNDFSVAAEVVGHQTGPVITLFELSLSPGVKVSQVSNLANDIARALAVPGVRIVSPIPGKDTIGVEVPNLEKEIVRIKELMNLVPDAEKKMYLPLYLGKDASGDGIVADLAGMPHLLIAGTTGSGKSVCINAIIVSVLMTRTPEDVRLILVDPKMVEMAAFENVPHLLCPIVNDMRKAEEILAWAAEKMDERYELLKEANVKNIAGFNRLSREEIYELFQVQSEEERLGVPTHLPYYVIIIDELADLIMTSSKEVEAYVIRIAQKARAVGIHMILATQRPSVNVVTGLIKANMPCRISFRVSSRQESRIVLDQNGADVLLGRGDMLFLQPGTSDLIRAQGAFVDDSEIRTVVAALRGTAQPQYNAELMRLQSPSVGEGGGERDELFDKGVEIVLALQRGSVSLLQRRLQIGYSRASRIIDQMADAGILGDYKGSQARECLMTLEDWQAMKGKIAQDQSGESSANGEPTSS